MTFMSHPTHTAECMPTRAEPYLYQHRYLFTVHPMMAAHCVCCGAQQSPQGPVLHPPQQKLWRMRSEFTVTAGRQKLAQFPNHQADVLDRWQADNQPASGPSRIRPHAVFSDAPAASRKHCSPCGILRESGQAEHRQQGHREQDRQAGACGGWSVRGSSRRRVASR